MRSGASFIRQRCVKKFPELWLSAWFGAAILVTAALPSSLSAPSLSRCLKSPEAWHWLGYDSFGRDLQFSMLAAALRSAGFALFSTLLAVLSALAVGPVIAMSPARSRFVALRVLDSLLAFPSLLLALGWAAVRGPGWGTLLASLLIGSVPSFVRLLYARSREILSEPYIAAARSLGAGPARVLFRHVLPPLGSVCAVKIPLLFAQALTAEATLSFLGIGAPVGEDTWGSLLAIGKEYLFEAPHIAFAAGIPLTATILALQIIASRWGQETPCHHTALASEARPRPS